MYKHALLGIPDDTPDSIMSAINSIAQEVAKEINAEFNLRDGVQNHGILNDIDIRIEPHRNLHIHIWYIPNHNLHEAAGEIGYGIVFPGNTELGKIGEHWELKLLGKGFNRPENMQAPFQWCLYHKDDDYRHIRPAHILDGRLLRSLIRERLLPPLPE